MFPSDLDVVASTAPDQLKRRADQRLTQIAVVIAARRIGLAGLVFPPTHVRGAYMMAAKVSMLWLKLDADAAILTAGGAATD